MAKKSDSFFRDLIVTQRGNFRKNLPIYSIYFNGLPTDAGSRPHEPRMRPPQTENKNRHP